jgi:hypothetical protein
MREVLAVMACQNDEQRLNRRCMQLEGLQLPGDTFPARLFAGGGQSSVQRCACEPWRYAARWAAAQR